MQYNALDKPLIDTVRTLQVPIYFFTGRFDYTTPFPLIEAYLNRLEAPHKEMVWFEESAHFPFFEEPERFTEAMLRIRDRQP